MRGDDCECAPAGPGPPPGFDLPPPPRPHFLYEVGDCSDAPLLEFESCDYMSVIDAEYHISPLIPPLAITVVSSFFFLTIAVLATALFWKHKNKMQHLFPCKRSQQNQYDVTDGDDVIYEDLTDIRPRPTLPKPSMEMIVVNSKENYVNKCTYSVMSHSQSPVFFCQGLGRENTSPDIYKRVYEDLSNVAGSRGNSGGVSKPGHGSGTEFAEDDLSISEESIVRDFSPNQVISSSPHAIRRETKSSEECDRGGFLYPRNQSYNSTNMKVLNPDGPHLLKSLDRRHKNPDCIDYHKGILLDTIFQMYPRVVAVPGSITQPIHQTYNCHKLPFILPVPGPITTHNNFEATPDQSGLQKLHPMFTFRPMKHDITSSYSENIIGGDHSEMDDCHTHQRAFK